MLRRRRRNGETTSLQVRATTALPRPARPRTLTIPYSNPALRPDLITGCDLRIHDIIRIYCSPILLLAHHVSFSNAADGLSEKSSPPPDLPILTLGGGAFGVIIFATKLEFSSIIHQGPRANQGGSKRCTAMQCNAMLVEPFALTFT